MRRQSGDKGRQDFEVRTGVSAKFCGTGIRRRFTAVRPKINVKSGLCRWVVQAAIDGAHAGGLMGSGSRGRNGPVETTENDNLNRTACSLSRVAADVSQFKGVAM